MCQIFSRNGKSFIHNKYSFGSRKKLVISINSCNAMILNYISIASLKNITLLLSCNILKKRMDIKNRKITNNLTVTIHFHLKKKSHFRSKSLQVVIR